MLGGPGDRWAAFEAAAKLAGVGPDLLDAAGWPAAGAGPAASVRFVDVGAGYRCAVAIAGRSAPSFTVAGLG